MEYYTTVFEIYSDDIDKTHDLTKELPYFNIKLELPKFRISGSHYSCDVNNKTIYKNIQSIKYLNETIAEQLYDMKDIQFDSFMDFLKVNPCNSKQTEILIKLDFFSEFGKSGKLMEIFNFYQARYDKTKFKKQIKKDKNPYPVEILSKYSKETEKQFNIIDEAGFCSEILATFEDKDLPITERLEAQSEYLGYIEYVNSKAKDCYYVLEVDTKHSPKLLCYNLQTGETQTIKIKKDKYYANPERVIMAEDIIQIITEPKPKWKKVGDDWVELEDKELWIKEYRIK